MLSIKDSFRSNVSMEEKADGEKVEKDIPCKQ